MKRREAEKEFRIMVVKMIQDFRIRMEKRTNRGPQYTKRN